MAEEKKTFKVFVTGGSEGLGLATVKALVRDGHKVVASTNSQEGARAIRKAGALPVYPDLSREGEVLSALHLANADIVVHAAPQIFTGAPQVDFDFKGCAQWLVDSTNAVVAAAGRNEVDKIISISPGYVYEAHHGEKSSESAHVTHDHDFDALFKAEMAVLDGGIDGYVIRTGYVYGGHTASTKSIADLLSNNRPLQVGKHAASWIHEDDLAEAILALVVAEPDGNTLAEIINVADDTPQAPNKFVQAIADLMGYSNVGFASNGILSLIRGETMRDKLLEREFVLNNSKMKSKYGWMPKYKSLVDGMDATGVIWRSASVYDPEEQEFYEDKAAIAIAALASGLALPEEVQAEEEAPKIEAKPVAQVEAKPAAPVEDAGPAPWNVGEDEMEEKKRKALERKAARASKRAGG